MSPEPLLEEASAFVFQILARIKMMASIFFVIHLTSDDHHDKFFLVKNYGL